MRLSKPVSPHAAIDAVTTRTSAPPTYGSPFVLLVVLLRRIILCGVLGGPNCTGEASALTSEFLEKAECLHVGNRSEWIDRASRSLTTRAHFSLRGGSSRPEGWAVPGRHEPVNRGSQSGRGRSRASEDRPRAARPLRGRGAS